MALMYLMPDQSTYYIVPKMTFRIEFNVTTKKRKIIPWTSEEWSFFQEQTRIEKEQQIIQEKIRLREEMKRKILDDLAEAELIKQGL